LSTQFQKIIYRQQQSSSAANTRVPVPIQDRFYPLQPIGLSAANARAEIRIILQIIQPVVILDRLILQPQHLDTQSQDSQADD
jgi:hypothetical protein